MDEKFSLESKNPTFFHSNYTVGWVCALPREQSAASFMLDRIHPPLKNPPNDNNAYILGNIGKHNIVIACLPMGLTGNNSSAAVATRMIATFVNIKIGLMVGIGGGLPQKNVRLGDVVISCPKGRSPGVVQWDFGKAEKGGKLRRTGSLDKPPTALLTTLSKLESDAVGSRAQVKEYLNDLKTRSGVPKSFVDPSMLKDVLYKSNYAHVDKIHTTGGDNFEDQMKNKAVDCALCDKNMVVERDPKADSINFHYGLIASGNQVIKDALVRNKLFDDLYEELTAETLCVEMEAAGLMNDFPCLVIRGICDYADSHKNDAWQDYAACVAAAFAKVLLTLLPPTEVDEMRSIKDLLPPGYFEKAIEFISPYLHWGSKGKDSINASANDSKKNQSCSTGSDQLNQATQPQEPQGALPATVDNIINSQPSHESGSGSRESGNANFDQIPSSAKLALVNHDNPECMRSEESGTEVMLKDDENTNQILSSPLAAEDYGEHDSKHGRIDIRSKLDNRQTDTYPDTGTQVTKRSTIHPLLMLDMVELIG